MTAEAQRITKYLEIMVGNMRAGLSMIMMDMFWPRWEFFPEGFEWAAIDQDGHILALSEKSLTGSYVEYPHVYDMGGGKELCWMAGRRMVLGYIDLSGYDAHAWLNSLRHRPANLVKGVDL